MGGEISKSQTDAQKAFEDYQKKRNSFRSEQKEEASAEEQKGKNILQEFRDRPRPELLPHACETWSGVWLGSLYDAMDADWVEREQITHAVSGTLAQNPFESNVKRLIAIVDDEDPGDIWQWFERVCTFIDGALSQGGRVLVHCEWGVSRSPTLVAAYLMHVTHRTPSACLEDLQALRDCVKPNKDFLKALEEWQGTLKIPASPEKITAAAPSEQEPVVAGDDKPSSSSRTAQPSSPASEEKGEHQTSPEKTSPVGLTSPASTKSVEVSKTSAPPSPSRLPTGKEMADALVNCKDSSGLSLDSMTDTEPFECNPAPPAQQPAPAPPDHRPVADHLSEWEDFFANPETPTTEVIPASAGQFLLTPVLSRIVSMATPAKEAGAQSEVVDMEEGASIPDGQGCQHLRGLPALSEAACRSGGSS